MTERRYKKVEEYLKHRIQTGVYGAKDSLPSENELCDQFAVTRTTVRKAMDQLEKEGFIERHHGKRSIVRERRLSLGLLNVKGFSEAVGNNVRTFFLEQPRYCKWDTNIQFVPTQQDLREQCIYFSRLRSVGEKPVMIEQNWLVAKYLKDFTELSFVNNSFFRTLSHHYQIEITGSEQELRAENPEAAIAGLLQISEGKPVLHISIKFHTSKAGFFIYSELFCNTQDFPVGNTYQL